MATSGEKSQSPDRSPKEVDIGVQASGRSMQSEDASPLTPQSFGMFNRKAPFGYKPYGGTQGAFSPTNNANTIQQFQQNNNIDTVF